MGAGDAGSTDRRPSTVPSSCGGPLSFAGGMLGDNSSSGRKRSTTDRNRRISREREASGYAESGQLYDASPEGQRARGKSQGLSMLEDATRAAALVTTTSGASSSATGQSEVPFWGGEAEGAGNSRPQTAPMGGDASTAGAGVGVEPERAFGPSVLQAAGALPAAAASSGDESFQGDESFISVARR